ncbi:MAG TPA: valine--tRNA ligase [Acidobacteriota bacterium]|nr:valine--tRNA ligase [Acidobacteriota bacterium]
MNDELPKHYETAANEERVRRHWLESRAFAASPDERDERYVIMMPLPNVTGALHMGHAMDNVMQDLLIRWHRMTGDNTLWMPGTDHAGIATQAVVEKRLFELEGKTRRDVGRETLVAKIWTWKDEYQQRIIKQQQSMGCSCDWDRQRFTMDRVCARAVREAFFRLFRDGLIYRGDRLVNWDCQLQTAVSDDEIVYEKIQGHFWHIRYPVIDRRQGEPEFVTVATTRPETMLGDTAVAVHPDPERALDRLIAEMPSRIKAAARKEKQQLTDELESLKRRKEEVLPNLLKLREMAEAGRRVMLPLMERELQLILDEWAKPELGSGCVKITPAHDPNDYDVWTRHSAEIDIINILNPDGTLNDNAGRYAGQDRFAARESVVADLEAQGLMEAIEDREIEIGHSDRSKTAIEPYLSKQWFIMMSDVDGGILCGRGTDREFKTRGLAQTAIDAIDHEYKSPSGRRLTFYPDHARYGGTYRSWLAEKRDWCISRQLWWGHRIPIWHGSFAHSELMPVLEKLPQSNPEELSVWVSDAGGALFSLDGLQDLDKGERFDILVCLRNEAAEGKHAEVLEAAGLAQDPDVLDTWFSSALWPFSTLGWPDPDTAVIEEGQSPLGAVDGRANCLDYYYPGSCLITGRDIITLWVARMLIMGLYLLGDVPFTACFIHANIQDGKGERMSKSKGNGIDPVDIIEKYGADAMRYVLCDMQTGTQDIRLPIQAISPFTGEVVDLATARHGRTIFTYICPGSGKEFDVLGTMPDLAMAKIISDRFDVGRAFCTKLWNAARFALMNLGSHEFEPVSDSDLAEEDCWILSRLSRAIDTVTRQLSNYNPSAAIGAARSFFWGELCDWYLELIKPRLKSEETAPVARTVLAFTLDQVLRLFHPFVPFITETLWEKLGQQCLVRGLEGPLESPELLILASWPDRLREREDKKTENDFALLQDVIRSIREMRARHGVSPGKTLSAVIKAGGQAASCIESLRHLVVQMTNLSALEIDSEAARPASAASQVIGDMEIYLAGVLDPVEEKAKLDKKLEKLRTEMSRSEKKLANDKFVLRAPQEVVEAERTKLAEFQAQISLIEKNLEALDKGEA